MDIETLKQLRNSGQTLVASHRGKTCANIPSNTLNAFEIALRQGAEIIELDVTKSIDGKLFVFHPFMDVPHLRNPFPMQLRTARSIKKSRYVNSDLLKTTYRVATFDEALDLLKGKCVVNIDKFWVNPKKIADTVRAHKMENQVIIKTYVKEKDIKAVEEVAPDFAYMPMVKKYEEGLIERIRKLGINLFAEELIFRSVDDYMFSDEHIELLHKNGVMAWVNTIVYYYRDVISGGLTDDRAVCGEEDEIWGRLLEKNVDIIQTDWLMELKNYLRSKQ